jgi:magnesium-transporting ATPase (P-type)
MGGDATLAKLKIIRESDNYYKTANEDIDLKRNYCENLEIEILMINEFTSDRGMMSIVVEYNNNVILYAKGGDKKIKDLLSKSQPLSNSTLPIATKLSETGLRVLLITMKILDKSEFNEWRMNYEEGLKTISEEKKNTYKNTNLKNIEKDMILIGCTAVEDRLQDEVPDVIKEIQDAGINFWVLTGDNLATARNIGNFN